MYAWWKHCFLLRGKLLQMKTQGWDKKPGVKIVFGRWQDSLEELEEYDGIFFDTYSEYYEDLRLVLAVCALWNLSVRRNKVFQRTWVFCDVSQMANHIWNSETGKVGSTIRCKASSKLHCWLVQGVSQSAAKAAGEGRLVQLLQWPSSRQSVLLPSIQWAVQARAAKTWAWDTIHQLANQCLWQEHLAKSG